MPLGPVAESFILGVRQSGIIQDNKDRREARKDREKLKKWSKDALETMNSTLTGVGEMQDVPSPYVTGAIADRPQEQGVNYAGPEGSAIGGLTRNAQAAAPAATKEIKGLTPQDMETVRNKLTKIASLNPELANEYEKMFVGRMALGANAHLTGATNALLQGDNAAATDALHKFYAYVPDGKKLGLKEKNGQMMYIDPKDGKEKPVDVDAIKMIQSSLGDPGALADFVFQRKEAERKAALEERGAKVQEGQLEVSRGDLLVKQAKQAEEERSGKVSRFKDYQLGMYYSAEAEAAAQKAAAAVAKAAAHGGLDLTEEDIDRKSKEIFDGSRATFFTKTVEQGQPVERLRAEFSGMTMEQLNNATALGTAISFANGLEGGTNAGIDLATKLAKIAKGTPGLSFSVPEKGLIAITNELPDGGTRTHTYKLPPSAAPLLVGLVRRPNPAAEAGIGPSPMGNLRNSPLLNTGALPLQPGR